VTIIKERIMAALEASLGRVVVTMVNVYGKQSVRSVVRGAKYTDVLVS